MNPLVLIQAPTVAGIHASVLIRAEPVLSRPLPPSQKKVPGGYRLVICWVALDRFGIFCLGG